MKKLTVLAGLVFASWAAATVCNQEYHLQEAYQYILTGNTMESLTAGARLKLDKPMGNATLLSDSTEYRMITDFDGKGTCDTWVKREVTFATRKKAATTWSSIPTSDLYLKINSGEFLFKKPGWDDYWFGLASQVSGETVELWDAIGKFKSDTQLKMWYGNATLTRIHRKDPAIGNIDSTRTHFYSELTSHPDSAALVKVLLDTWKAFTPSPNLELKFKVQLIKILYDSMPTPITRIAGAKAKANGFHASQTGNLVLIKAGYKVVGTEPLTLLGMMGNKITTLHATGHYYQWNGKTAQGAEASPGVYFVQAGNRILGKFFYSR